MKACSLSYPWREQDGVQVKEETSTEELNLSDVEQHKL